MFLRLVVPALLLLGEAVALAFDPRGHEVIEAAAYRELLARPRVDEAGVSGKEILAFLIRRGVLARPRCFESAPDDDRCGEAARRDRPIDFWPVLGSGSPDLLESRQLTSRGQCHHFLADGDDARGRTREAAGVSTGMSRDAYARCIRLLTSLYDEILRDPYAAFIRGRGTYILLHVLADSFSRAHVVRDGDGTGKVRYLKIWILRSWLLYPFDARHFDARVHHAVVDDRDADYIDRERRVAKGSCDDAVVPYEVPPECLTVEAQAARATLVDALVTLYVVLNRRAAAPAEPSKGAALPINLDSESTAVARPSASLDDAVARDAWHDFLEAHLASESAPLVVAKQRPGEREWQPNLLIAASLGADFAGGWDAGVTVGGMQVVRRALPLLPLETLRLGYARYGDESHFVLRGELTFLVPIWDHLGVGVAPLGAGVDCVHDFSSCRGALVTTPARLDFVADAGVWVEVTGPEYDWVARAWRDRIGVSVGGAFDVLGKLKPGSRHRPAASHFAWDPPPLDGKMLRSTPLAYGFFVEGDMAGSTGDRLLGAGIEVRRERDRHGRRAGLGTGATLAYQRGRLGDRRLDDLRVAPHVTWFLVPGTLAVRASPASIAVGRWGEDPYLDVGLAAQLSLSVSALEVSLSAPRLSYVHRDENHFAPVTLRFSWRLQD